MDVIESDMQCLVCTRPFSLESSDIDTLESLAICPDCKQIVLTNLEIQTRSMEPNPTRYRRTRRSSRPRSRLTRTGSMDDSDPDSFAHHFNHIINSARQNNSSNRWRVVSSDNESELDGSIFGESELDASSFGLYGPDSDAYMSDHDFFAQFNTNIVIDNNDNNNNNNNNNINNGGGYYYDDDGNYDIDPMRTGLGHGNWDTEEEESEWEEISELDMSNTNFNPNSIPNPNSSPSLTPSPQWMRSRWRMGQLEIEITQPFQFEELLEELAEEEEEESYRRAVGLATSQSFRERIPRVVMRESELICAVCKDEMSVGIKVLKLPCQHMYHEWCIEPWLKSRNTCPVCRYELPVEKGGLERYEDESNGEELDVELEEEEQEEEEEVVVETRMEEGEDRSEIRSEGGSGGWLFLAAAPLVSLVGIVLVLCFKNVSSCSNRTGEDQRFNERASEGRKRWWSIF